MSGHDSLRSPWLAATALPLVLVTACDGPGDSGHPRPRQDNANAATVSVVVAQRSESGAPSGHPDAQPIEIDTKIGPKMDWDAGYFVVVFTLPKTNTETYEVILSSDKEGAAVMGQPLASRSSDVKTLRLRRSDLEGVERLWVRLRRNTGDPVDAIREFRVEGTQTRKTFLCAGGFESAILRDKDAGVAFATPVSFTLMLTD